MRKNCILPVWSYSLRYHLQWLTHWQLTTFWLWQISVKLVESWMQLIIISKHWWRIVKRLTPKFNLLSSIYFLELLFVSAFECSIMTFIYLPSSHRYEIFLSQLLKDDLISFICSGKVWCVGEIKLVSKFFKHLTCYMGFLSAFLIKWYIDPSTATTSLIPNRLSMPNKNNLKGAFLIAFFFPYDILIIW